MQNEKAMTMQRRARKLDNLEYLAQQSNTKGIVLQLNSWSYTELLMTRNSSISLLVGYDITGGHI